LENACINTPANTYDKSPTNGIKVENVHSSSLKIDESVSKSIKCIDQNNKVIKKKQKIIENFKDSLEEIPISNNTSIL
jgi:hypothetical protein